MSNGKAELLKQIDEVASRFGKPDNAQTFKSLTRQPSPDPKDRSQSTIKKRMQMNMLNKQALENFKEMVPQGYAQHAVMSMHSR